ncbi:MAG TPA: transglycosylase SLT domain-containing protein [Thermodesulfobacteriota bacterium]|nr:transglycosylase SLT domain-containing protein [Thermodesulfobacteriota bacterium]
MGSISFCFFLFLAGCATSSHQPASPYNAPYSPNLAETFESAGTPPTMTLQPIDQLTNPIGFQYGNIQKINNSPESNHYVSVLRNLVKYNGNYLTELSVFYYNPIGNFAFFLYLQKDNKSTTLIFTPWNFSHIERLIRPQGFKYQNFLAHEYSWEGYQYACILKNLYNKGVIQSDFSLVYNSPVATFIQYFQNKENFMKAALGRAETYRPLMTSIFREHEIPEDLVYLSLIESGFNPHAYSSAGACGPWQLMKGTARRYGLRVDKWVDERRDPEKSTQAAVRYLKDLYTMFGDWYLALTAYNAGEGKVAAAIQRYNSTDLWYLREKTYLKQESCDFVPKLLAAITIGKKPGEYGFAACDSSAPIPHLTKVHIPFSVDLKMIAATAEISLSELQRYNPELCSTRTPPDRQGYWIKIPASKEEIFTKNFSQHKDQLKKSSATVIDAAGGKHRVKSGETLGVIARKYNTSVSQLMKLNGIKNPHTLRLGQILRIPTP